MSDMKTTGLFIRTRRLPVLLGITVLITVIVVAGMSSANPSVPVPSVDDPGTIFGNLIVFTAIINIPINYLIVMVPLMVIFRRETRREFWNYAELQSFLVPMAIGVSILGAFIDLSVVFVNDIGGGYHWTYRPNILNWCAGLFLIYLTFFLPLLYQFRSSIHVPVLIANFAVIVNIATWLMLPQFVLWEGQAQVKAAKTEYFVSNSFEICMASILLFVVLIMITLTMGRHLSNRIWFPGRHTKPHGTVHEFEIFVRALSVVFVSIMIFFMTALLVNPGSSQGIFTTLGVCVAIVMILIAAKVWPFRFND